MQRNYFKQSQHTVIPQDIVNRTAFHEAGHAVAVYRYNRQQQLPPVYFSINLKNVASACVKKSIAKIDGGRLIQSPSLAVKALRGSFNDGGEQLESSFRAACEADIVNLLSGPIAEAKYVAWNDGEELNAGFLNLQSLHRYGGSSDLKTIQTYLHSVFSDETEKNFKLAQLFRTAFDFVSQDSNWRAIRALAHYIGDNDKQLIECEEAIAVIEREMPMNALWAAS